MKFFTFNWLALTVCILLFLPTAAFAQNSVNSTTRTSDFDVQNYIIRVKFDASHKKVFGDTTVQFKPLAENFNRLELDAVDLLFDSVTLEPSGENLKFIADNGKVSVIFDKTYSPSDSISVHFKYSTSPAKGVYFVDAFIDHKKEIHSAQIWTQGEAEEARYWIPSYDFPNDKAASEEYITVKNDETAIGNGEFIEKIANPDGTQTFHYKMSIPHSVYLVSFVIGKYSKISEKYKNVDLSYYVYPGEESFVPTAYGKTKKMLEIYEQLTGVDFPYNKYDQTMVANFQFGGMENITATTMADTDIRLANYAFGKRIAEDLVSHELSHSWFGDLVTCKDWSNLWLNEGFATFMEAAYREKMYGRADYLTALRQDYQEFAADEAIGKNRHALDNPKPDPTSQDLFDVTTYKKGGLVVHTLRETVGDQAFWKAINVYLNRYKYQNVDYTNLQSVMEEVSGQKLDWFFKQWVLGAGMPRLEIEPTYSAKNQTLTVKIKQTQANDGITPPVFMLPFEVEIKSRTSTKIENFVIKNQQEVFTFKTNAKPTVLKFDPNEKIPLKIIKVANLKVTK